MRTTLDLPDPLFRELKTRAASQGHKLKDLVAVYIEAGLHGVAPSAQPSTERPRRSPLPVARRASELNIPAMTNTQLQSILDDEDSQRTR